MRIAYRHSPCGSVDWNRGVTGIHTSLARSLPLRECGLKLILHASALVRICHSPCGSVDWNWNFIKHDICKNVTPLAGVWIEISMRFRDISPVACHSPCGSVDWNFNQHPDICQVNVTPLAGVWIEIEAIAPEIEKRKSLPLRECGLKFLSNFLLRSGMSVTPLAGVWIEITQSSCYLTVRFRHSPCGSVDWNTALQKIVDGRLSHSPCGSVDWNLDDAEHLKKTNVTPLAGVWIEIPLSTIFWMMPIVTPLAGVWIEIIRFCQV